MGFKHKDKVPWGWEEDAGLFLSRHRSRQLGVARHYGQGSKGSALVTAGLREELGRAVEVFLKGILRKGVPNNADAHSGTCVIT